MTTVNLTLPLYPFMPVGNVWAWDSPFQLTPTMTHERHGLSTHRMSFHSEAGTRLMLGACYDDDAPRMHELDYGTLINRETVVIDVPKGPGGEITAEDIDRTLVEDPDYRDGDAALLRTGWGDDERYRPGGHRPAPDPPARLRLTLPGEGRVALPPPGLRASLYGGPMLVVSSRSRAVTEVAAARRAHRIGRIPAPTVRGPPAIRFSINPHRQGEAIRASALFYYPRTGEERTMTINIETTGKDRLAALRASLSEEFAVQTARLKELQEISADTGDPGDAHNQAALLAATRHNLEQITGALRRIAEGGYGRCEKCAGAIPVERLEILPHARFCVPCQQKHNG